MEDVQMPSHSIIELPIKINKNASRNFRQEDENKHSNFQQALDEQNAQAAPIKKGKMGIPTGILYIIQCLILLPVNV